MLRLAEFLGKLWQLTICFLEELSFMTAVVSENLFLYFNEKHDSRNALFSMSKIFKIDAIEV